MNRLWDAGGGFWFDKRQSLVLRAHESHFGSWLRALEQLETNRWMAVFLLQDIYCNLDAVKGLHYANTFHGSSQHERTRPFRDAKSLESIAVKYGNYMTWHRAFGRVWRCLQRPTDPCIVHLGAMQEGGTRRSIQQQPAGNHPNPDWQNRQSGRQLVLAPTMQWTFHRSQQPRLARLPTRKSAAGLLGCLLQWGKKQERLDCICVNCVLCKHV